MVHNVIYAIGGFNGLDALDEVESYDISRNQWTLLSPLNERRTKAGVTNDGS